ncbi:MAG: DNA replication and repair protein RecF [Actinobacteria bacterium]|nr:DNA replication and repair protein RecF [Actinomycetota bacterium]
MILAHIRLADVRCHCALETNLGPRINVVVGGNGAGKSSVLEAVCLDLQGNSPRTHRVTDCISVGKDHLRVEILLVPESGTERNSEEACAGAADAAGQRQTTAAVSFMRTGERRHTADGRVLKKADRWAKLAPVHTFFPDDLRLIKGGPNRRRQFLDDLVSARNSEYALSVGRYAKALAHRNALLQRGDIGSQHDPWEWILAEEGTAIVETRAGELAVFAPLYTCIHGRLTSGVSEGIKLVYRTNVGGLNVEEYRNILADQRAGDCRRTFTHSGPHRDDIRFMLEGIDLREAGSQGEQRTALLGLILSAAESVAASTSIRPILLLDDVMSELDYARRRALIALLAEGGQSIVTTTDLHHFEEEEIQDITVIRLESPSSSGTEVRPDDEMTEAT